MQTILHDTAKKINYFDLFDFVSKIKLKPQVLEHLEETNQNFDKYFKKLSKYDDEFILYFWISLAYDEIKNNNHVENHTFSTLDLSVKDVFFDNLNISHNRIHNIHKFAMQDSKDKENIGKYRKDEVRISYIGKDYEEIFWYGVNKEDIKKFMDTFIEIYKTNNMSLIDSNPFLKSSLIHLLFLKIHPYKDGNGRTSRILHNIKFTEALNKIYKMNLKICPVNLSKSINICKPTYVDILDNIYFDLDHDNNTQINKWFNFLLNMYDEQLFMNSNMINNMDDIIERIQKIKERQGTEEIIQSKKPRIRY
ncbi:MAG: Fic family protein [bacterium]|nr:Fic family protein [bacterium]